ncbi:FiLamiN (Actin binding protein) [Dirofilaria immitis]|nr:FiLamiN (Actin binding protein) [Dirofilaria immitis]
MIGQRYDTTWKSIQLNTFTRWVRQKLKQVNVTVSDLKTDFEEGLKLIRLIEVLSGKSFGRHNKKVLFRHQKLENISLALQFLENEEHIKLINIDSTAIADHNLKLILGLIWTLILHYSISKQIWNDHLNDELENGEVSAREKLLAWLRTKLPTELSVTNFTFDWNDGILLGALVDSCAPDLKIDWRKWSPSQALQSTFTAMQLANDYLGVATLIEPEELISPAVDEKVAKYTPTFGQLHDVVLMPIVGVSTTFTLHTRDTMVIPEVIIKGSDESSIHCIQRQLSENIYEFRYTPEITGEYEIIVRDSATNNLTKLIKTKVTAIEGIDISSISINGLNNESIIIIGQRQDIIIDIGNLTPLKNGIEVSVEEIDGSKYLISLEHEHNSNIYKVREYLIIVQPGDDTFNYQAIGEGLEYAIVDIPAKFLVDMKNNGKDKMDVVINGPSKVITNVTDNFDGTYTVEYIVEIPGLYEIKIYYGDSGKQIPGSPYMIMADYKRDPSKILITEYSNGYARAKKPNSLIIDATLTALEPISAHLPDNFEQPIVEEIKSRIYQITFIPNVATNEIIMLKLMYGNEPLGKPLNFIVKSDEDLEFIVLKNLSGGFLSSIVRASLQFQALIDVRKAEKIDQLVVEIKGPDDKLRKSMLIRNHDDRMYLMNFVPDLIGLYVIVVYVNGRQFSNPYNLIALPVGLANKCFVESKPFDKFWIIGEPKVFMINAKNGGEGALNILSNMINLESKIEKNEDGIYTVTLIPHTVGQYRIVLMYGGVSIPGAIFDFQCIQSVENDGKISGEIKYNNEQLIPYSFRFSVTSEYQFDKLTASVKRPSGINDNAYIENNEDGNVIVKYYPKECGIHILSMQHDNVNMSGSPISFYVKEADEEYATVYGPGLLHAVVGESAAFTVCAKGSPTKELSVAVEGIARATIRCHDNKDGTCSVVWIPPVPGEYKIHITTNIDSGTKIENLSALVKSPNGIEKPCFIRSIDSTQIGISFSPHEIGEHLITIKENEQIMRKLNFEIDDIKSQNGDASKVIVSGTGKTNAICQQNNNITNKNFNHFYYKILYKYNNNNSNNDNDDNNNNNNSDNDNDDNNSDNNNNNSDNNNNSNNNNSDNNNNNNNNSDNNNSNNDNSDDSNNNNNNSYGDLSLIIQGPSRVEMKCIENNGGIANIIYKPFEPGIYTLSVKFADIHVNDSPFTINCTGKGMDIVKESANKKVEQVPIILAEQNTAIYLHHGNISLRDTKVKIIDPNGYSDDVNIRDLSDNLYRIEFRPIVDGSPFQFTVGYMAEMGSHRIHASGNALKRAEANKKQSFNLYTREAGQGELEVIVEGPSKAELQFHEHEDGNCHFDYKVTKAGEYLISVKFNAEHIPDSPFKVLVAPATGEVRRLKLISLSNSETPGEVCKFMINKHGAIGHLEAKLHTSINEIEAINILPIDDGSDSYYGQFIPLESGDYYVVVTLDDIPMYGTPFHFRIGASQNSDPSLIAVIGEGIRSGQTGQNSEFIITTCNVEKGFLQIQIDGPSKVILNSCEIDTIAKINKAIIDQVPIFPGNANKVIVNGSGLHKFSPGQLAIFNIDTALAGDNILYVGLFTSKGPCNEVTLQHLGNGQYTVKYLIDEQVKGFIFIKYGDINIPGSPFAISF